MSKIGDFVPTGVGLPKNFTWKGSPPTNHTSSQRTIINVLSYSIKIWTDLSSILSGITRVTDRQTDGRTDGRTDRILIARPRLHFMQRGKNQQKKHMAHVTQCSLFVCLVYCPLNFTYDGDSDTCLKKVVQLVTWSEANTLCHNEHPRAHLVVISDEGKQTRVVDFMGGEHILSYRECLKWLHLICHKPIFVEMI